jgi:hypothetical protein
MPRCTAPVGVAVAVAGARWMNAPSKQITMPRFEPPYLTKKAQRSTLPLYQHIESRMLQHAKLHKL